MIRGCVRIGGEETVRVAIRQAGFDKIAHKVDRMGDYKPEFVYESSGVAEIDPRDDASIATLNESADARLVAVADGLDLPVIAGYRLLAAKLDPRHPILLKDSLTIAQDPEAEFLPTLLAAATNIGSLLCDGIGDAILVQGEHGPGQAMRLSYNILQAAGTRIFKTDYVACPSCGRTLFNLQTTTARIKAATVHLEGREDRDHGLHRERPRRDGGCGFRLRRRRARQGESLRRQNRGEIQHPRSGRGGSSAGFDPRTRQMGRSRPGRADG